MLRRIKTQFLLPIAEMQQDRNVTSKLRTLNADAMLTAEQRLLRKQKQIHAILQIAQKKVPYYKELFKKIDFSPESILRDVRHIQELPYLTKDDVVNEGDRLINSDFSKSQLHLRKTNGSTGPATKIYYCKDSLDWTSAANLFSLSLTGRKLYQKEYWLQTSHSSQSESFKERIKHWILNRECNKAFAFDETALRQMIEEISRAKPYVVHGHPSTMYALAKYAEKVGLQETQLFKAFESTGESLDKKKTEVIRNAFGCEIYNRYGNAEFGVIAHSRENPEILEVLDYMCFTEAVSLGNGLDEIAVTTTTNIAMPLIRYKTGDIGKIVTKNGKTCITQLHGRYHEILDIEGHQISTHSIQSQLDVVGDVDEFQIITQNKIPQEIRVVANQSCRRDQVATNLRRIFKNDDLNVVFTGFDGLVLSGWRDKFKFVVEK